jgi:urea transport system ATP-binding protein
MSLLTVNALNQSYGGSHTLWDIDFAVQKGSRTCLMGRNGMGKTTLLKCIMGLLPVTSGVMTFAGTDLQALPAERRARLGIGYVPQGREIFSHLTVEENLRVGLGVRKDRARAIPPRIFELFPVLRDMLPAAGKDSENPGRSRQSEGSAGFEAMAGTRRMVHQRVAYELGRQPQAAERIPLKG